MADVLESTTISVSICASPQLVYEFVSNPENLPLWAPGFCKSARRSEHGWLVESADGPVVLRFADRNPYGVLDHVVRTPAGLEFHNPMRVIPNGTGSEVLFTLFRTASMPDQQFARDARLVEKDLRTLKQIIENDPAT